MAINETIVTGRKFRKLANAATKQWQRLSFWHKASDCEFNDGKNAETKLGAVDGITDSLASTSSRIAASAKAVNSLNNNLNAKVPGSVKLVVEGSGANTKYYIQNGADSASKKLLGSGNNSVIIRGGATGEHLAYATSGSTITVTGFSKIIVNEASLVTYNGSQTEHESYIRLTANGNEIFRIGNYTGNVKITPGTVYNIPSGECSLNYFIACFKNKGVLDLKIVP